jgi:hypothetical protein
MGQQCTLAVSESQHRFEKCLVCKWPLEARSDENVRLFCSVCSALGNVRINLQFLEGSGRRDRNIALKAYGLTGRGGICVAILKRKDGLYHFEFDLWRVDWDLRAEVGEKLLQKWNSQMAEYRDHIGKRRMECCFGKRYSFIDVFPEDVDYWKAVLTALLTNNSGLEYIGLGHIR